MYKPLRSKELEDSINREFKPTFMYKDVQSAVAGMHKELREWCNNIAQKSAVDSMI